MGHAREAIAKNIKRFRLAAGMTQKQLADALNVGASAIANWEKGANAPDVETLFALCETLHVSIDDVYGRTAPRTSSFLSEEAISYLNEVHSRPELRALFSVSKKATKDEIEQVIKMIEAFKGND